MVNQNIKHAKCDYQLYEFNCNSYNYSSIVNHCEYYIFVYTKYTLPYPILYTRIIQYVQSIIGTSEQ